MTERWLTINGHEGQYEVSDLGRVRSLLAPRGWVLKVPKILKQHPWGYKMRYLRIVLSRDYKLDNRYVHELVLTTFVDPCPKGMECRHWDGNPTNNALSNLLWGTPKENGQDRVRHGTSRLGYLASIGKVA